MSDDAYVDCRGGGGKGEALLKGTWECFYISQARLYEIGSGCCRGMFFDH